MSNIIRWDPYREMINLRRTMDRLFDDTMVAGTQDWQSIDWDLALDVIENEGGFIVKASVPGIKPENLDITFDNNILTIKGETKEEKEVKENRYHLRERRFGSFSRSVSLPANVRSDSIQADYEAGVLTLRLPKAEETKPQRIPIQVSEKNLIEG